MQIREAIACFELQLQADGRSVHTRAQYARHLRLLQNWLQEHRIEEVTHTDVARFLVSPVATHRPDGKPKKATSMNALRSSVRAFFGYVHAAGFVTSNAARLVRRARCGTAPPRGLSDGDQKRLLDTLANASGEEAKRDSMLFAVLLATGIRLGSAIELRIEDVDIERGELRLRRMKGDREDVVFVAPAVAERLRAFVGERTNGALFMSRSGERLSARQVQRRLAGWCGQAGLRRACSPHGLRHAFAINLYERTRDVLVVQAAMKHRSIMSTMVYARASAECVRQAIHLV